VAKYANIVDRDQGYAALKRRIADLGDMTLDVGVFDEAPAYKGGVSPVQMAFWQEFGTYKADGSPHIPPRPFMRLYVDGQPGRIDNLLRAASVQVATGTLQPKQALARLGMQMVADIKARIHVEFNGAYPHNAVQTVKKKGFDYPLFETGILLNAITHKVEVTP
jgi:hypothetical protein